MLQAGQQRLNGAQVEQLVRHLPEPKVVPSVASAKTYLLRVSSNRSRPPVALK